MEKAIRMIYLLDDNGSSESVAAEEISPGVYQLLENPIFSCLINYGSIVKASEKEDGKITVERLVRKSNFKTRRYILSSSANLIDLQIKLEQPLSDAGITWELVMGGLLLLNIPIDSTFDIDTLFAENKFFPTEMVE
jgi:hypothetical protein